MNTFFVKWFKYTFFPKVKKFQEEKDDYCWIMLHSFIPSSETLNAINNELKVKLFLPNVTFLVQSIDQKLIETLKRLYRKELMRRLIFLDNQNDKTFLSFYKKIYLKNCCYILVKTC